MKELLQQLAAYNVWATQQITEVILSLPEEKQKAEIPSSFNSLYKTVLHMWDAESIWFQRIKSPGQIVVPGKDLTRSMNEVINGLFQQSGEWKKWVNEISEKELTDIFHYRTLAGEPFSQPMYQVVAHVFNHGTYHRGQLINMLRQLGIEKLPQTDFAVWGRNQK